METLTPMRLLLGGLGLAVVAALVWQAVTAHGNPNPLAPRLDHRAIVVDSAILVLREGLEAILVLAAVTASFLGGHAPYKRPVAIGGCLAFAATVATWFAVVALISAVNAPALDIQAVTGLLAILVLLVVMNWFFHKVYWTAWIAHHNRRRRDLLDPTAGGGKRRLLIGLGLLGFTAVYREGFEIVLFLQNLRLQAGTGVVLQGVALGLTFTAAVGALTFLAHRRLPYKKMLVATGVMLGFVLVVMTGESAQELQQAGWLGMTPIGISLPDWLGLWFAIFPTVQSLLAQAAAGTLVIGSYLAAEELRVKRPRRRHEHAAQRAEQAPTNA